MNLTHLFLELKSIFLASFIAKKLLGARRSFVHYPKNAALLYYTVNPAVRRGLNPEVSTISAGWCLKPMRHYYRLKTVLPYLTINSIQI